MGSSKRDHGGQNQKHFCVSTFRMNVVTRLPLLCRPVPAAEEFPVAVGELPVADVARADHSDRFDESGALRCLLHDDGLHQPSSSQHL